MVKTRSKAALLRSLANNQGLANNLAENQMKYGDWREMFRRIDKLDAVTNEDVKRVANEVFVDTNRTVGILETKPGLRPRGHSNDEEDSDGGDGRRVAAGFHAGAGEDGVRAAGHQLETDCDSRRCRRSSRRNRRGWCCRTA